MLYRMRSYFITWEEKFMLEQKKEPLAIKKPGLRVNNSGPPAKPVITARRLADQCLELSDLDLGSLSIAGEESPPSENKRVGCQSQLATRKAESSLTILKTLAMGTGGSTSKSVSSHGASSAMSVSSLSATPILENKTQSRAPGRQSGTFATSGALDIFMEVTNSQKGQAQPGLGPNKSQPQPKLSLGENRKRKWVEEALEVSQETPSGEGVLHKPYFNP